jgi:outer membrane protein assembly factor BamB
MKSNMKNSARCYGLALFVIALLFAASYGAGQCAAMAYISAYDSEWMPFQTMSLPAFDAKTGEMIWHAQLEDWAVTDPVIAGNVIYVAVGNHEGQEGTGHLYALDRQTGAELWTFQADSRILSAPGVGNGAIYVQVFSGTLYAVE